MLSLSLHENLYFYCIILFCVTLVCFCYLTFTPDYLPCIVFGLQMSVFSLPYIGFANGASRSTRNLSFVAWAIYAPSNELICLQGVCLDQETNNIAKYSAVIELLTNVISLGIFRSIIRLDSQLVVLQLNNVYTILSPTLLRVYLRIHLLELHFDYIENQHIPRCLNILTNALANYVLDRHLRHL
jgi:ribonuclease HI